MCWPPRQEPRRLQGLHATGIRTASAASLSVHTEMRAARALELWCELVTNLLKSLLSRRSMKGQRVDEDGANARSLHAGATAR